MLQLLVIGCGGAVGALMRYGLGWRITLLAGGGFPWGTLFVNGLQIGLLGGFTTFSAFSIDAITLFDQGLWLRGLLYIVTTVVVSVLGAYLGMSVGRNF